MSSNTYYNLFLDDQRSSKFLNDIRVWTTVRNYKEFVEIIERQGLPKMISFDHDLAMEHYPFMEKDGGIGNPKTIPYDTYKEMTGYHCAKWLVDYCLDRNLPLPEFQTHSMNPVGRENINALLENFRKFQKENGICQKN